MTALAAAALGYRVHVFCPEAGGPAAQVSAVETVATYDDTAALQRFAGAVDVATFEFENIPTATIATIAEHVPVFPSLRCLAVAQDRIDEKTFLNESGAPTAPFQPVTSPQDLAEALTVIGRPAVLKTARLGYDGKGQVRIDEGTDPAAAFAAMGADRGILEGFVDFEREVSVILARAQGGQSAAFDVVENRHRDHILDVTIAPAPIPGDLAERARAFALKIADALDLVGLLAVEMFVTRDGALLVNEIAPRPHNSGHWTIDACVTNQFEQFVRAICGLPLGDPRRHSDAVMTNLIGEDVNQVDDLLGEPDAKVHLYGKAEARPRRKMGHVTRLYGLGCGPESV
jgi:5-(carboxyamino)imidazole ribonucleotide synthase